MKNVHLLPTEKASRLYKDQNNVFKLDIEAYGSGSQCIYITSDEEIKEGDWCLGMDGIFQYKGKVNLPDVELPKKIILTTDQDLFNDGIQSIDKEFLEWFVKNPSCESVEVEKVEGRYVDYRGNVHKPISYEIIIPQEAPKQEMAGKAFYESADKVIVVKRQEPLEEAAQSIAIHCNGIFIPGAEWQAERMYSEEQVLYILNELHKSPHALMDVGLKEWFEQFKNK